MGPASLTFKLHLFYVVLVQDLLKLINLMVSTGQGGVIHRYIGYSLRCMVNVCTYRDRQIMGFIGFYVFFIYFMKFSECHCVILGRLYAIIIFLKRNGLEMLAKVGVVLQLYTMWLQIKIVPVHKLQCQFIMHGKYVR